MSMPGMTQAEAEALAEQFAADSEGGRYDDSFVAELDAASATERWVVTRKRPGHPDMRVAG